MKLIVRVCQGRGRGEKSKRVEEQGEEEERGRLGKRRGPTEEFNCLAVSN